MTEPRLTPVDIEILMESLDALESKAMSEKLTGTMLKLMLVARSKEDAERLMSEDELKMKELEQQQRQLKEKIIVLKAKLLGMRDASILHESGIG